MLAKPEDTGSESVLFAGILFDCRVTPSAGPSKYVGEGSHSVATEQKTERPSSATSASAYVAA